MVDIAASDVTVTVEKKDRTTKARRHRVSIAFGNGALTYPSGGVPMPAVGSFGMVRRLDFINLFEPASANGLVYKFDKTNSKIRIYEGDYAQVGDAPLVELDAGSDAPAAATLYGEAVGW